MLWIGGEQVQVITPVPAKIKKLCCPKCGMELINLSVEEESNFCCDECDLDITLNSSEALPVIIEDGSVRLEWEDNGHGLCGDFDGSADSDYHTLDFNVYISDEFEDDDAIFWDSLWSLPTQINADEPIEFLLEELYKQFEYFRELLKERSEEVLQLNDQEVTPYYYPYES